jgi:hypothetical protein
MSPTRRGRALLATLITLLVVAGVVGGVLYLGGRNGIGPLAHGDDSRRGDVTSPSSSPLPTVCPLSGKKPVGGAVPDRPALAVKVENVPAARPQTGLSWADIVYEEPVEAGITRFIAVYQCQNASRIEPVRSGRLTDPDILRQFGTPIFAYAGAVPQVYQKVAAAHLHDVNFNKPGAMNHVYFRDTARLAPHNLWTSTRALYAFAHVHDGVPAPVFDYSKHFHGMRISGIHLPFSSYSDVYWRWDSSKKVWLRFHGTAPHLLSDGTQVSAVNVVVQVVRVYLTDIHDVNGVQSPEVVATGSGKAYVLRGGKVIEGTWSRPKLSDVTVFKDRTGKEIHLAAGNTWVELLPNTILATLLQ